MLAAPSSVKSGRGGWLAYPIDVVLITLAGACFFIAITGGGVFSVAGLRVTTTRVSNPLMFLAVLAVLRCWLSPAHGFLGLNTMTPVAVCSSTMRWGETLLRLERPSRATTVRILLAVAVGSVVLRV